MLAGRIRFSPKSWPRYAFSKVADGRTVATAYALEYILPTGQRGVWWVPMKTRRFDPYHERARRSIARKYIPE